MPEIEQSRKNIIVAKLIAAVIAISTIYAIIDVFIPSIPNPEFAGLEFSVFMSIFMIMMISLGIYMIIIAVRLWRQVTIKTVRRSAIAVTLISYTVLLGILRLLAPLTGLEFEVMSAPTSIIMLSALPLYLYIKRALLKIFSLPNTIDWPARQTSAHIYFFCVALFAFSDIGQVLDDIIEIWPGSYGLHLLILPLALALVIIIYKTGMKLAMRNKPKSQTPKLAEKAMQISKIK